MKIPGRPVAGHQPGTARPLAHAGRQDHRVGLEVVEREHRRTEAQLDSCGSGTVGQRAGVPRATHHPVQIAHAEPEMVGVAGDPAGVLFPFVQRDLSHPETPQLDRSRQARRSAADDGDTPIERTHGATLQPVRLHSSAWQ